jgi:nucleoside-diphosphate-sugar epimerase
MIGEALVITGTGQETRDFNYIDDTVSGTLAASGSQKAVGKIFNIGSGRETKIIDIANIVNRITKNKSEIKFVEKRKWDNITSRVASIEKAQKLIDYSAQVKLEEGLKKTYEWLRQVDFNKCAF